jgi:hypothetical protein
MKERDHVSYIDVDGRIILNLVLKKQGGRFVKWIRLGSGQGPMAGSSAKALILELKYLDEEEMQRFYK